MASSRTLSPRNSSRSYEDARSGAQDECVNTFSSRSGGRASISATRPALLVGSDVVDRLPDCLDLLSVLVRDLDPEPGFSLAPAHLRGARMLTRSLQAALTADRPCDARLPGRPFGSHLRSP